MQGWQLGLRLGLAAFVVFLVSQVAPVLFLPFVVMGVAMAAVLRGDARARGRAAMQPATLGLVLLVVGFTGTFMAVSASGAALARDPQADLGPFLWMRFASEVAMGAGFYFAPLHFAADRSRLFLGLAFGASIAVAAGIAYAASTQSREAVESASLARGLPFILFAWAYAMILGRLQREGGPKPAPVA